MTDEQLQLEHRLWLADVYPDQPAFVPMAGMVEEAGELLHAVLCMEKERRWGPDPRHAWKEELEDAVGDCAIYCCSFCNATGQAYNSKRVAYPGEGSALDLAVQFVRSAAMHASTTYASYATDVYMGLLVHLAGRLGVDFAAAVERTWEKVKRRGRSGARLKELGL